MYPLTRRPCHACDLWRFASGDLSMPALPENCLLMAIERGVFQEEPDLAVSLRNKWNFIPSSVTPSGKKQGFSRCKHLSDSARAESCLRHGTVQSMGLLAPNPGRGLRPLHPQQTNQTRLPCNGLSKRPRAIKPALPWPSATLRAPRPG